MTREEYSRAKKDGIHIDNSDLKDMAEDIEHFANRFQDFMDPENPLQAEAIKLDAELRWSEGVQKLAKMVMKDFGISSVQDLQKAVMIIG